MRDYLVNEVLAIKNGKLTSYANIGLFVEVCTLYADKYGAECIDLIDSLADEDDRNNIFGYYVKAFQWRKASEINSESFWGNIKKYGCGLDDLWSTLICNSTKVKHPLNAGFLHNLLMNYSLKQRDYLWTIYINDFTYDDGNRVVQIINDLNQGKVIEMESEEQYELLLTLLTWLLTSSNRILRDCASKAMIEILKNHFALCLVLLNKFEGVNDPYIIQRLYGVIFGACCKRISTESLKDVAEYTYGAIFNKQSVYPDILLRDYARLIIEKFLNEEPECTSNIERSRIEPPYTSEDIPEVKTIEYEDNMGSGTSSIIWSMKFEGMGMYGDFGRYVYQSALNDFDVDEIKIHAYSLYYIFHTLGYEEELFGEYDRKCGSYGRNNTIKIERIGKKYQWITMYNVLARVSDNYERIDRYAYDGPEVLSFSGAWEPYVRDFDPTLNEHFMVCKDAPVFRQLNDFISNEKDNSLNIDISSDDSQKEWLSSAECPFICNYRDTCLLIDDNGGEWIALTKYIDTGRKNLAESKCLLWSWAYAYFVTDSQAEKIKEYYQSGKPIINSAIASHHEAYTVFNREYPWSPACKELNDFAWVELELCTGEYKKESIEAPYIPWIDDYTKETISETDKMSIAFGEQGTMHKTVINRPVVESFGKILHSTTGLLWEEEYDASKKEVLSYNVPCGLLIKDMNLKQLKSDGFYYDIDNRLAAFDTQLTQNIGGVVIRKNLLIDFLRKNNKKLVWIVDLQKEIHETGSYISNYSKFEGVYVLDEDGSIDGSISFRGIKR